MSTHEGDTQGGGGDGWLRASWRPESNEAELVQPHSAGRKLPPPGTACHQGLFTPRLDFR